MKILSYQFLDNEWEIQKVEFQDLNLIVGDSGTGKTRLLNTIFNLGVSIAQSKLMTSVGSWDINLAIEKDVYHWILSTGIEGDEYVVSKEELYLNDEKILERNNTEVTFNGKETLKLPKNEFSLSTLREEEKIKPLYEGFTNILRRRFFSDDLERSSGFQTINNNILKKIGEAKDLDRLYKADLSLNLRLYILEEYFTDIYKNIISLYKETFEYITEAKMVMSNNLTDFDIPLASTPIFCIKERSSQKWIRLDHLSSGMQKSLLIITDLFSLPSETIYMIDEYENSLGIGAINVLPDGLSITKSKMQIFVTSHHPYIITKFPVENWYVAHRKGSKVSFAHGEKLVARYAASKQDKYLQLVNDPFYTEGIE